MNSCARILTTITILLATTVAMAESIKGEHISQVFAAACAENNFANYQAWALKNHFMLRQFESPTYQISPNEIKDDELFFSVTINDQNKWQAKLRDQKLTGDDPCDLAMSYLSAKAPKQISMLTLLIPEAHAQKLVNESTTTNWLLGALATAAITDGAFIENLSNKFTLTNSMMLAAAFRAINTIGSSESQTNFEKLFAQQPELLCSRNRVKIYGKDTHIIVKKGYVPFRLGFHESLKGKALKGESQILKSGKVYEHLLSLGQRCNHDGDSETISAQLQAERNLLNMKIARAALLNRSISSDK